MSCLLYSYHVTPFNHVCWCARFVFSLRLFIVTFLLLFILLDLFETKHLLIRKTPPPCCKKRFPLRWFCLALLLPPCPNINDIFSNMFSKHSSDRVSILSRLRVFAFVQCRRVKFVHAYMRGFGGKWLSPSNSLPPCAVVFVLSFIFGKSCPEARLALARIATMALARFVVFGREAVASTDGRRAIRPPMTLLVVRYARWSGWAEGACTLAIRVRNR